MLGARGRKHFEIRCAPTSGGTYESMASNEWWIADNHTFDVITQGDNGQRHRLHLTAFFEPAAVFLPGAMSP